MTKPAHALATALIGVLLAAIGCGSVGQERAPAQAGVDPGRGRAAIEKYGCAACHTIPGIAGANGLVGPPLTGIASRVYLGGVLANTPDNMVRWIMHPRLVDEKTAMPEMGVTEREARDITAYLYTLR